MPQIVFGAVVSLGLNAAIGALTDKFAPKTALPSTPMAYSPAAVDPVHYTPYERHETFDLALKDPLTSAAESPLTVAPAPGGAQIGLFGRRRIGGRVIFSARDSSNNDWLVIVLAGSPATINGVYLDNLLVARDGSGFVTTPPYNSSCCRITWYTGSQTAVDAGLTAAFASWSSQFIGTQCTYAVVRFTKSANATAFGAGVPNITFDVTGFPAYDPRTGATGATSNAALIAAAYLTHELGAGLPTSAVDWASVAAAANVCDEAVTLKAGGTEARYSAALYWTTDERHEDVLARAGQAMGGGVYVAGKLFKLCVGSWPGGTPEPVTTDDYSIGGLAFSDAPPIASAVNGVRGVFASPLHNYELRDFPAYQDATALSQDGGREQWLDLRLDAVTSQTQAQRLARNAYRQARRGAGAAVELQFSKFNTVADDVISLTDAMAGFSAQTFRVISDALSPDFAVQLGLRLEDAAMYDWTASADELAFITYSSPLASAVTTTGSASGDTGALVLAGGLISDNSGTTGYYSSTLPDNTTPAAYSSWPTVDNQTRYGPGVQIRVAVAVSPSLPAPSYKARMVYRQIVESYAGNAITYQGTTTNTYTVDAVASGGVCTFAALQEYIAKGTTGGDNVAHWTRVRYLIDSISLDTSQSGSDNWSTLYTGGADVTAFDGASNMFGTLAAPCAPYVASGSGLAYTIKTNQVQGALSANIECQAFDTLATTGGTVIGTTANISGGASFAVSGAAATGKYYRVRTKNAAGTVVSAWSNPCLIVFQ